MGLHSEERLSTYNPTPLLHEKVVASTPISLELKER